LRSGTIRSVTCDHAQFVLTIVGRQSEGSLTLSLIPVPNPIPDHNPNPIPNPKSYRRVISH